MASVFQECVAEVKAQSKTVLMSSHILADVEKLCDRICIIRQGEIVETGTLQEMRQLTHTEVTVETSRPILDLEHIPGLEDVNVHGTTASFKADKEALDTVMAHLVKFNLKSLVSTPPTLEELFMRHYGDDLVALNQRMERSGS